MDSKYSPDHFRPLCIQTWGQPNSGQVPPAPWSLSGPTSVIGNHPHLFLRIRISHSLSHWPCCPWCPGPGISGNQWWRPCPLSLLQHLSWLNFLQLHSKYWLKKIIGSIIFSCKPFLSFLRLLEIKLNSLMLSAGPVGSGHSCLTSCIFTHTPPSFSLLHASWS